MTAMLQATGAALRAGLPPDAGGLIAEAAAAWLKPLVARAGALINGEADGRGARTSLGAAGGGRRADAARRMIAPPMNDPRSYPERPILAVSAAIMRDGKVLVVRRARKPALDLYTLPGGAVETGETLHRGGHARSARGDAARRSSRSRSPATARRSCATRKGACERHFVILCFAARWLAGEPVLNEELDEARWLDPAEVGKLKTTEGLAEIVAAAAGLVAAQG